MDKIKGASSQIAKLPEALQELRFILGKLISMHRNLLDVLREEYAHMASLDLNGLAEAARAKEVLLDEIWNGEQLRIKVSDKLAVSLGLQKDAATLLSIAASLPAQEAEALRASRTTLSLLLSQAKEANAKNMEFAASSLGRIDQLKKNALGLSNNTNKENYSNSGMCQPLPGQGGRLLSTEA